MSITGASFTASLSSSRSCCGKTKRGTLSIWPPSPRSRREAAASMARLSRRCSLAEWFLENSFELRLVPNPNQDAGRLSTRHLFDLFRRTRDPIVMLARPTGGLRGVYQEPAPRGLDGLKAAYIDGGFSGGSLERPALQRLLEDVPAGRVDIVVVYKVDRHLTPSCRHQLFAHRSGRCVRQRTNARAFLLLLLRQPPNDQG